MVPESEAELQTGGGKSEGLGTNWKDSQRATRSRKQLKHVHHRADRRRSCGPSHSSTHLSDKKETTSAHNGNLNAMCSARAVRSEVETILRNAVTAVPGSRSGVTRQLGGSIGDLDHRGQKKHGEGVSVAVVFCVHRRTAMPLRLRTSHACSSGPQLHFKKC